MKRLGQTTIIKLAFWLTGLCFSQAAWSVETGSVSPLMRFTLAAGLESAFVEVGEATGLPAVPHQGTYGSENPTEGSFQTWTLLNVRTVESLSIDLGGDRYLTVGAGFDSVGSGKSWGRLAKEEGGEFELQLLSLTTEIGIHKRLNDGQGIEILTAFDVPLNGKARFLYVGMDRYGAVSNVSMSESVKSGWRLFLMGRYFVDVAYPLQLGLQLGGHFGQLKLQNRADSAAIYGSLAEIFLQLVVD